jgi:hypothetical protein
MIRNALRAVAVPAVLALTPMAAAAQQKVMLPAADRALAGRPADVFAIGAAEGQSWEMLSQVSQLTFDSRDNLYVLDQGNARVLMFDRSGRFVRQVGKKGDGPGEFQFPNGLAVRGDGSVLVMDVAHRSVSHFGPDGTFLRTYPYPEELGFPASQMALDPSGGVVINGRPRLRPDNPAASSTASQFIARLSLSATPNVTRLLEFPDYTRTASQSSGNRRMFIARMPEFTPPVLWGVLPDGGVAVSNSALYTLNLTDASGRVVRLIQRPVRVRRTTEADREFARQRQRAMMNGRGQGAVRITINAGGGGGAPPRGADSPPSQQQVEAMLGDIEFRDTIPTLQGLTLAPSGKLWIERTAEKLSDPGPIDLVSARGEYLGTITGQRRPLAISASGRAAYVERDELEIERVVVRQLPAGWR